MKDVLTERGTVSTDDRTNVLIVKDIPEALVRAEGLVRNLDTETPQVLIESRIVEASSNFNRALGVQWGGNAAMNQANGNPTGLIFPNNIGATGAAGGRPHHRHGQRPPTTRSTSRRPSARARAAASASPSARSAAPST